MRYIFLCLLTFLLIDKYSSQIIQDINLPNGTMNNPRTIQATNDNGFIVTGDSALGITGYFSSKILKLDSSLNIEWSDTRPPRSCPWNKNSFVCHDGSFLMTDTKDDNIYSCAQSILLKYKPNGNLDWEYNFNYPFWNAPGAITEINGEIYMLWERFSENYLFNSEAETEWLIVKFSANGDSIGSINITDLSPPGMYMKVYKHIITTSDNHLILSGYGQSWLTSLTSNPINQAVTAPLLQKIDVSGDLIWDYTEIPEHKQVPYFGQFLHTVELPCGDIIAFGNNVTDIPRGYSIRFNSFGELISITNPKQISNNFFSGTYYQNCGFINVGTISLSPPLNIQIAQGSFIHAVNQSDQELFSISLLNLSPQDYIENILGICPMSYDNNKFALLMKSTNATRLVIIGDYQNELNIEDNQEQAELSIFPNPSDGIFQVSCLSNAPMHITILDQQGKQLVAFELNELSSKNSFDLSEQAPGVYFAHISQGENQWVKKLVVR
jgi:hypothetical protein